MIIRASAMPGFADCARMQAARAFPELAGSSGHVLRTLKTSIGACVGSAVHASIAIAAERMMKCEPLPSLREITATVKDYLTGAIKDGVLWDKTTRTFDQAVTQSTRMADTAIRNVLAEMHVVDFETRLTATIDLDGIQIELSLSGSRDLLELLCCGGYGLNDWKTGVHERSHILQFGCYDLLSEHAGRPIKRNRQWYIQRVGVSKPQPAPELTEYDPVEAMAAARFELGRVARAIAAFQLSGNPREFQANPNCMMCSQGHCPAWGTSWCREHKGA